MNDSPRILLADDEDLFRDTTADLLRKAGYAVDCASDAAEAARMLSADRYDVLIADIKMPGNAQLQLVLEVNEVDRGLPIILVTGYPAVETAIHAVKLAAMAYMVKPVDVDELLVQVKAAVARSRLYRTVVSLQERLTLWSGEVSRVEHVLRERFSVEVSEPARSLLTTTFGMVAKSLIDVRRVTEVLAMTDDSVRPEDVEGPLGTSNLVEGALRETIQTLEESRHVFKSKRLKELRQQLQGVLGALEREKAASGTTPVAAPHYHLRAPVSRCALPIPREE